MGSPEPAAALLSLPCGCGLGHAGGGPGLLRRTRVLDPLYTGAYPASMVSLVPGLPEFSGQEAEALRSAGIDFLGLNHYTSRFIAGAPPHEAQEGAPRTFFTDQRVAVSSTCIRHCSWHLLHAMGHVQPRSMECLEERALSSTGHGS